MLGFVSGRMGASKARSPSGKAKICKTFIGGSIPPRASKFAAMINPHGEPGVTKPRQLVH